MDLFPAKVATKPGFWKQIGWNARRKKVKV
jgi:hypothetical protein